MKLRYNLITTLIVLIIATLIFSCDDQAQKITDVADYEAFLNAPESDQLQRLDADYIFWQEKLDKHPNQFPYLVKTAGAATGIFQQTGKIAKLKEAETHLVLANEKTNYNNPSYLRALSRNYISQHRFKESLKLLIKAEAIGDELRATQKMLFDVHLELGNVKAAYSNLNKIKDLSDFDYLIRIAKWSDHEGNLDATIQYMEKAMAIAERSNNIALKNWSYTNIADYYGHDGQVEKSYNHYLKALELDPNNAYAKKGIAWIIYSYEGNTEEALRIVNTIKEAHTSPDYELFIAEMASTKNDDATKKVAIYNFIKTLKQEEKNYGQMYNAHLCNVLLEELDQTERALDLAANEVKERPTAMSYDLLAWAHYKNNDLEKAVDYADNYVRGKTHEPMALFHLATIYKAKDADNDFTKSAKQELLESAFELGPELMKQVRNL